MATIGNLQVRNTGEIISPSLRLCAMMWAKAKYGKTKWAAGLDKVTKRWYNKKTLFIAVEAADGGGTSSIADNGVDYVEPSTFGEFQAIVSSLQSDTTYGGVVVDNASDLVKRLVQPEALKIAFPSAPDTRRKGVPEQRDYQTMGEMLRTELNKLVNLTKRDVNENIRKHLIVTALEYERTTRGNPPQTISIGPALPGQMADTASAMFQTMLTIEVEAKVDPQTKTRKYERLVVAEADGVKILGDRLSIFPARGPFDLEEVWEKYWIPRVEGKTKVEVV